MNPSYTTEGLIRYVDCPMKYLYQEVYGLPYLDIKDWSRQQRESLKAAAMDLYVRLLQGEKISLQECLDQFDARILSVTADADRPFTKLAPEIANGRLQMRALYNVMTRDDVVIKAVGQKYSAWIDTSGTRKSKALVTGSIDVVRQKGRRYEVVYIDTRKKMLSSFEMKVNTRAAFLRMILPKALRTVLPETAGKKPRIVYVHVESGQEIELTVAVELEKAWRSWVHKIAKAIKNRIFYPRYSKQCTQCPYRKICSPVHAVEDNIKSRKRTSTQLRVKMGYTLT